MAYFVNTILADTYSATAADDDFGPEPGELGDGNDLFIGKGGSDFAAGGRDRDTLYGGVENDFLYGGDGDDSLYGGGDNDWIECGLGNDQVFGGSGSDDRVVFNRAVTLTLVPGTSIAYGGGLQTRLSGIEIFNLSRFADSFTGRGARDEVYGGAGNDTLRGMAGDDNLNAGDGRDVIYGGDGGDAISAFGSSGGKRLYGDAGRDFISLGTGNDTVFGGSGNDLIQMFNGDASTDIITCGTGDDTVTWRDGADSLYGGAGQDEIQFVFTGRVTLDLRLATQTITENGVGVQFSGFEDVIVTSAGARVTGTSDANEIWGMQGNDVIFGLAGNDTIFAGWDQDRVDGGAGNDRIEDNGRFEAVLQPDTFTGGKGVDTFVFKAVACSPNIAGKMDIITDFKHGTDKIDLRGAYESLPDFSRLIEYTFIGNRAFSGNQDELRFSGGILRGDVDGNGTADFALKLTDVTTLTADDLLL